MIKEFKPIVPNIYRLEVTFTGCWTGVTLVLGNKNVLIDSGSCSETVDSEIVPALKQMGLGMKDIHYVALTHTHGDHVGGCRRLLELNPSMKVVCYASSIERMLDPLKYSKAIRATFPGHSPAAPKVLMGVKPDLLLQDGERLESLILIHTPGHDSDTVCYLDERTKTLITGDSLQLNGTVTQGCALLMDTEGYEKSLKKLLNMDIQNIVCGHPYLPLGAEAIGEVESRAYLQSCFACHMYDKGFVQGMIASGTKDSVAIAKALIREVGGQEPSFLFLPLYTVTQYMKKEKLLK